MTAVIPQRIFDYKIKASSPAGELATLYRLLAEAGGYASTVMRRDYAQTARKCRTRLSRIEAELKRRGVIASADELFDVPDGPIVESALSQLSVDDLERLYRQRPRRVEARIADGREHFTCYFESRIVAELSRRTPADGAERLKIDYCKLTHAAELENMSSILGLPQGADAAALHEAPRRYTPAELAAMISESRSPQTLAERERLVELVDCAIDMLDTADDMQPMARLAAELVELGRTKAVRCPQRVVGMLAEAVAQWTRTPRAEETEMVIPMLTLALVNKDRTLERRAQRIINRCYRACLAAPAYTPQAIDRFYIAATCSSYVTRFSPRKLSAAWTAFTSLHP